MNKLITPDQFYKDVAKYVAKAEQENGLQPGELFKAIAEAGRKLDAAPCQTKNRKIWPFNV